MASGWASTGLDELRPIGCAIDWVARASVLNFLFAISDGMNIRTSVEFDVCIAVATDLGLDDFVYSVVTTC